MGLFDNYPYTDFHRLNLDWVLKDISTRICDLEDRVAALEQQTKEVDNHGSV